MSLFFMSVLLVSILTVFDLIDSTLTVLNISKKLIAVFLAITVLLKSFDVTIAAEFNFNAALFPLLVLIPYFLNIRKVVNMKKTVPLAITAGLIISVVFKLCGENIVFSLLADSFMILIFSFFDSPVSGICAAPVIPVSFGIGCTAFDIIKSGFGFLSLNETIIDMQLVGLFVAVLISEIHLVINKNKFESRRI